MAPVNLSRPPGREYCREDGANHFPNTFAVSLNPMRGCDNYQISIHIARMERVKQLAALAAALLQLMLLPLMLLLLLLLLLLLPCPHCLCDSISAVVLCFCCCCPCITPEFLMRIRVYLLNYNAVAPDPAHRCLNACSASKMLYRPFVVI